MFDDEELIETKDLLDAFGGTSDDELEERLCEVGVGVEKAFSRGSLFFCFGVSKSK